MHSDPVDEALEALEDAQPEVALELLTGVLREEPYQGHLFALRALILSDLERLEEAREDVVRALETTPEHPFVHYAAAMLALQEGRVDDAIAAARAAQAIMPDYHDAMLLEARAFGTAGAWADAARIARRVAEEDPENGEAAVFAAVAESVGRDGMLDPEKWQRLSERFPLSATARAAAGWTRLRAGGYREARQDFEQALALDPTLPWAREGLVFALKARSPVYGLLLRFFHWSGNFTPRTRNLMALGAVLAYSVLRRQGEAYPALKPVIIPLLAAYLAFMLLTWLADPLLNLMLFARPDTRRLLQQDERRSGLLVGGALLTALVLVVTGMAFKWDGGLRGAFGIGFATIAISAVFLSRGARKRKWLGALALIAVCGGIGAAALGGDLSAICLAVSVLATVISTWSTRFGSAA